MGVARRPKRPRLDRLGQPVGLDDREADIGDSFGDGLLQAVATGPAVRTVVAVSVAVVGARPVVSSPPGSASSPPSALTLLGPSFGLDDWVLALSPFWHVPNVGTTDPSWGGLLGVTAVTMALLAIGFAGFRRRDLAR